MSTQDTPTRASRRSAITWMLSAASTMPFLNGGTLPEKPTSYDPKSHRWSRTFSKAQLSLVTSLANIVLPGEDQRPSASALQIPDFIDEWISAPFPSRKKDRSSVLEGLNWINKESRKRFKKGFTKLSLTHQLAICNDISDPRTSKAIYAAPVAFFLLFQKLTYGAYFTTEFGKEELGDDPLPTFELPDQAETQ